jgi:uroporphyrin-III C-methyltransferase/precorrin-2 dehydrogenase/sirohydrochlorin ferrochelatase
MRRGLPGSAEAIIAANVSKPDETLIHGTLETLGARVRLHDITGCAILMIRWPKSLAAVEQRPMTAA